MFVLPVINVLAVFVRKTQPILLQPYIVTIRITMHAVQILNVLQVFAKNLYASLWVLVKHA
jgi:hypothetical protein